MEQQPKRLFLAVAIPEKFQKLLLEKLVDKDADWVHWQKGNKFHATLVFLGEQSVEVEQVLKTKFRDLASKTAPFNLQLTSLTPCATRTLRIIVRGEKSEKSEDSFLSLEHSTHDIVNKELGIKDTVSSHITLARFPKIKSESQISSWIDSYIKQYSPIFETEIVGTKLNSFLVEEFVLFESTLSSGEYHRVETFHLSN
jgi:2'-5' RNA ligase